MASRNRIPRWSLLFVFLCFLGFTEAIRKAPCPTLLLDSGAEKTHGKGTSMQGSVAESQTVITERGEIEEGRILFAEGAGTMSNTMDYPTPGPNRDHNPPKGHNGNGN